MLRSAPSLPDSSHRQRFGMPLGWGSNLSATLWLTIRNRPWKPGCPGHVWWFWSASWGPCWVWEHFISHSWDPNTRGCWNVKYPPETHSKLKSREICFTMIFNCIITALICAKFQNGRLPEAKFQWCYISAYYREISQNGRRDLVKSCDTLWWCLKSPAIRLITQQFIWADNKKTLKLRITFLWN